jgi:hypothetical protein
MSAGLDLHQGETELRNEGRAATGAATPERTAPAL